MEKCQCSFWRKCCPCLCRCKAVKNIIKSPVNLGKSCSCSIWRKCFCLCYCKQVAEESDNISDLLASKNVSKSVTELHSISCLKYKDEVCSGKSYSPAAFIDGKLVKINSCKLIEKKCEREVAMLSGGLNGQNILTFIGIYFRPNSSLPILVTEKIEFSLLQHIETSHNQYLQISENYKLLSNICSGLNFLHNAKIVHLNLSTKSVLLTDKLIPKISNFEYAMYMNPPKNFATLSEDDLLFIRSRDDHFVFQFLPPDYLDVLQNSKQRHIKFIDVYSFGCVILNMFTHWPSVPQSNKEDTCNPKDCQNFWLSVIADYDTEISNIVKICIDRNPDHKIKTEELLQKLQSVTMAKEVTMNPPLTRKISKDRCKFTEKSSSMQTTILQPSQGNNKTVTLPEVKHVAIQTPCKKSIVKIASTQTENAKFKGASSQTKQVKFKNATSQTVESKVNFRDTSLQSTKFKDTLSQNDKIAADIIQRHTIYQKQYKHSLEENKMILGKINQLERELISLRKIVDHKNEELEKYHAKCIKAEEESFAFTNTFSTACEGSVFNLQNVYRHMQHNVRSAAVRAHKKKHPNVPLQLSHHGMVAYDKAKNIAFQAFSDIINNSLFQMQPPHSEPIQPQQDNTLKQCMKLLACFHGSIKHAEEDIKQSLLQEYEKNTSGTIPEDVEKYYSMLAKFTWDCVARTIPMIMSTDETKFNKEIHELKDCDEDDGDGDDDKEKHISYVYPILFTSNSWPREVAIKGKVKY